VLDFVPRWILVWAIPLLFAAMIVFAGLFSLVGLPPVWTIIAIAVVIFAVVPVGIVSYRRNHGLERPEDGMPSGRLDSWLDKRPQDGMPSGRLDSWLSKRD
jgi:hypothetical protein